MARISVDSSAVSHNKNGENGGGVTYVMGGNGGSGSYNSLTVQSINAANGNIDYLKSKSISANDMSMIYISAVDGTIQKLKGSSANFDQGYFSALGADTIDANKLTVKDIDAINAWIETLQSREITTEYLTVTKQAHFFELIIDKIRSVGGQLIITPASCTADYVWGVDSNGDLIPATPDNYSNTDYYDIFWRTTQDDGRSVTNDWIVNDQAICQSFNNVSEGVNYDVANKYYWRLVTQVSGITSGYDDVWVNLSTGALSNSENNPACNEFEVIMYKTTSILDNHAYDNNISWGCKAQTINGIETNVSWTNGTLGTDEVVHGIFKSASQLYGIQIEPTITENLPATTNFQLQIKQKGADDTYSIIPEKINIAVYFTDDTFLMWNDVSLDANGNFFFNMVDANSAIKSIIVNSTEDVKWHKCHRIRVSNNYIPKDEQHPTVPANNSGCDYVAVESASVPSIGDNLIQLGYRGNDDVKRQSAIIIAAYMTPDAGLTCPSYAHYMGINDFHLSDHRHSYFDANGAKFLGDITFANVGNMTAKDKWMKLNVASTPIEIYEGESHSPSTRTISPSTYDLNITTVNDNTGNSETLTYVPSDYRLFIYYYDDNGKIDYGPEEVYRTDSTEGSLLGLPAKLYVTVHNDNTDSDEIHFVKKIECVLVKGVNPANNIIDKVEIEYGYNEYWNTDSWCLIPLKETAYATILDRFNTDAAGYSTNTVKLNVNFQYKAGHYKNGGMTNVLFDYDAITNPHGLRLAVHVYNQGVAGTGQGQENPPINEMPGQTYINDFEHNWVLSQDSSTYTFTTDNYLKNIYNQYPAYQDYINNYKNSNTRTLNPIMFRIDLVKNDVVLDSRTVYVAMQSGSIEKLTNDSYVRAISKSNEYTDKAMTGPLGDITALQNDMTTIQQWATGISQTVDSNYNELTGDIGDVNDRIDGLTGPNGAITNVSETLHSEIEQTAGMIRTEVRRDYGNSAYHIDSSNSYWTMIDTDTDDFDADKYYLVNVAYQQNYERKYVYTFQVENESNENFDLMLNVTYISASDGDWVGGNKYVNEYYLQNADIVIGDVAEDTDAWEMKFYVRGKHKYIFRCPETFYACGYLYTTNNQHIYPDPTQVHNSVTEPQNYRPTESSIEQTAERISLSVIETDGLSKEELRRTGIDITNGRIDLNAEKTVVHGNLNLTDTENGMTVYDANGMPSINIQPNPITQITPSDNDAFQSIQFNLTHHSTTPFWDGTSSGFTCDNNSQIILQTPDINLYSGTTTYPSSDSLSCRIKIYNTAQNNPFVHIINCMFNKTFNGNYRLKSSPIINITGQIDGETYYIDLYIDSFSNDTDKSATYSTAAFASNMYTGGFQQTYIGTDGFYVHTGTNQLFKADSDKILMQMGWSGLKLRKINTNTSGILETIAGTAQKTGGEHIPNWVSFYNYIPMKQLNDGSWDSKSIICTNGGQSETKYVYSMDAATINGDILIVSPKIDENNYNEPLESWIVLPPDTWTDTNGYVHHLPVGFRVTIWNNFYRWISSSTVPVTRYADVRVTPYRVDNTARTTIIDTHRDYNDYIVLDTSQEQCVETFVYVGFEIGSRPGSTACWLAMHDAN